MFRNYMQALGAAYEVHCKAVEFAKQSDQKPSFLKTEAPIIKAPTQSAIFVRAVLLQRPLPVLCFMKYGSTIVIKTFN